MTTKPSHEPTLKAGPHFLSKLRSAILSMLATTAGCSYYGIEGSSELIGAGIEIIKCQKDRLDGGKLGYQKLSGSCDSEASEMGVHGVLGDANIWNRLALRMTPEEVGNFVAIDLPGHGNSSVSSFDQKTNPRIMGEYIAEAAELLLSKEGGRTLYCHSAGAPSCIFALQHLKPEDRVILINPILAATRESVFNPARNFPILCGLGELATSIALRGFSVNYDPEKETRGPSLLGLGGKKNGETAQAGNLILNNRKTTTQERADQLKGRCEDARQFANSIRQYGPINEWRDDYFQLLEKYKYQITVILTPGDPVIDSRQSEEFIAEEGLEGIKVVWLGKPGAHEIMSTEPEILYEAIKKAKGG